MKSRSFDIPPPKRPPPPPKPKPEPPPKRPTGRPKGSIKRTVVDRRANPRVADRAVRNKAPRRAEFKLTKKQTELNKLLGSEARHIMLVGGARSGKTFLIVRAIVIRALRAAGSRHAIIRFRYNAVRASIWLDTLPKVLRLCFPQLVLGENVEEHRADGYVKFPNGSEIWFAGLDEKERVEKILGQEYLSIFFNECSQLPWASVLIARTRLAQAFPGMALKAYYDLNPIGTAHWTHRVFIEGVDPDSRNPIVNRYAYAWAYINPKDNSENLDPATLEEFENLPPRQKRRFWDGLYSAEIEGALWSYEVIDHCHIGRNEVPQTLTKVIVAVDPSGTSGDEDKRSDAVGIVVVGSDISGNAYVLADLTCKLSPEGWGRVVADAYHRYFADRVVAERNFGGDMVRAVIQAQDRRVKVRLVTASRGKAVRAEPVSVFYGHQIKETWHGDRVKHAGEFRELEEELLNFSSAGYQGDRSPNRADALVWGITDLLGKPFVQQRMRVPSPPAIAIYAR